MRAPRRLLARSESSAVSASPGYAPRERVRRNTPREYPFLAIEGEEKFTNRCMIVGFFAASAALLPTTGIGVPASLAGDPCGVVN